MSITEAQRLRLYESLKHQIGTDEAGTLMNMIPPVNLRLDAIDSHLAAFGSRFDAIDGRFAAIDDRFDAIDGRFAAIDDRFDAIDGRFAAIDDRFDAIDGRFAGVHERLDTITLSMVTSTDLADLRSDAVRTFGTWLFASQAVVIAAVAMLVGLLGR